MKIFAKLAAGRMPPSRALANLKELLRQMPQT
jgi:hypothetical protein